MNIAEKRRAEGLVEEWSSRRTGLISTQEAAGIELIPEPQTVERVRAKIELEISKLASAGFDFEFGPQYGHRGARVKITRSATNPSVLAQKELARTAKTTVGVQARSMVARIWGNDIEFDELAKLIA